MTALLEARGFSAGYHGHPVVHDLDIEVHPGEVVALLGPNGAGKTTTLMALAGAIRPLSGEVMFNGEPEKRPLHARARNGLAFVTEERAVFMGLTTMDNLRVADCDVNRVIALFPEIEKLLKRKASQLSGGEQQMLSLGRALARRPKLLLADELSLGLAPLVVERLLKAVRAAADEDNVGVLLVEQHVHQALRYADRVYALRRGKVITSGTVQEVTPHLEAAYLASEPTAPVSTNGA
jgi:ABC-type branched-subunit amino acid transport system ATPase component